MVNNKYNIKKIIFSIVWVLVGFGCITLLVSAVHNKESKNCKGVDITISGVNNNFFIDKNDVYAIIKNYGGDSTERKPLATINLKHIEKELEKDVWIKNAELYFDNNDILKVSVEEREPVARIFTSTGKSFYIDTACMLLPLSTKFSARLPIITGFIYNDKSLSKIDSAILIDIKNIGIKINADSFLMAMIEQVDITANYTFEMIPKIGKQLIVFGDAGDADAKFTKLKLFYKNIITQAGWNKYSIINLQYAGQVVASIRGQADVASDSLKTLQLIQFIADEAARKSADSLQSFLPDAVKNNTDSMLMQQSIEREDESIDATSSAQKPLPVVLPTATLPAVVKPTTVKPVVAKPIIAKPTIVKPTVAKPVITKPTTTKPAIIKPAKPAATAKPVVKKPIVKPKPTNDY